MKRIIYLKIFNLIIVFHGNDISFYLREDVHFGTLFRLAMSTIIHIKSTNQYVFVYFNISIYICEKFGNTSSLC